MTPDAERTPSTVALPRRLAAMLYDGLLVLAVVLLGTLPLVLLNEGEAIPAETWWYRLYLVALAGGYFVFFWVSGGETLGMRSWRIRVVGEDGGPVTLRAATIRVLAAMLSWLPLGAGFLWSLADPGRLAWHDRLSGTRLVRTERR